MACAWLIPAVLKVPLMGGFAVEPEGSTYNRAWGPDSTCICVDNVNVGVAWPACECGYLRRLHGRGVRVNRPLVSSKTKSMAWPVRLLGYGLLVRGRSKYGGMKIWNGRTCVTASVRRRRQRRWAWAASSSGGGRRGTWPQSGFPLCGILARIRPVANQ